MIIEVSSAPAGSTDDDLLAVPFFEGAGGPEPGPGAAEAALDPAFRADLADATGRRVGLPGGHGADCSARGAAVLAALAIDGVMPGPEPAVPAAEPDPARAAIWDGLWASYERARYAIAQHCHADPGVAQESS